MRIIRESMPELKIIIVGIIAACANGSIMPIFAIIYAEIVATFQKPDPAVRNSLHLIVIYPSFYSYGG